jgi:dTDP-4-dehydrorhamnose reductase
MKLAVIGASGLVGGELLRRAKKRSIASVGAARSIRGEATGVVDLSDRKSIAAFLETESPSHVAIASAWPYVDGCEKDPERSRRDNIVTVENLIAEAGSSTTIIFFSTDHVFDGKKAAPYVESDKTNPLSVYAKHKLEVEELLAARGRSLVVRTAWAFGEELGKKNFVYRVAAAARSGELLRVPKNQSGCPTWTGWLTDTTLSLLNDGIGGIVHVTGKQVFSKREWAVEIADALGLEGLRVEETSWTESGQIAPRPAHVALESERHTYVQPSVRSLLAELSI